MIRLLSTCTPAATWRVCGANDSLNNDLPVSRNALGPVAPGFFPPEVVVQIKALACELPKRCGVPLSRWSADELAAEVIVSGLVASISGSTVWRWLNEDAIRPWYRRSWIFPRDPAFETKAGRVLDLYHRVWEGAPLGANDFVLSADEKTSIQARRRCHPTTPPRPGQLERLEHEYERLGAWAYLAAWDVHRAKVFGRCERTTGIRPFDRLVRQVMTQPPYSEAERVYWIVDNGSSHRGQRSIERLRRRYRRHPELVLVHLPVHASWLNQIEIYFSIVQRKVLTPNDFDTLREVPERLLDFQSRYEAIAKPFRWAFTRQDLTNVLKTLDMHAARAPMQDAA